MTTPDQTSLHDATDAANACQETKVTSSSRFLARSSDPLLLSGGPGDDTRFRICVNLIGGWSKPERSQSPEKRLKSTIVLAALQQVLPLKHRPRARSRSRCLWRQATRSLTATIGDARARPRVALPVRTSISRPRTSNPLRAKPRWPRLLASTRLGGK